jgi:hypothetical protein
MLAEAGEYGKLLVGGRGFTLRYDFTASGEREENMWPRPVCSSLWTCQMEGIRRSDEIELTELHSPARLPAEKAVAQS